MSVSADRALLINADEEDLGTRLSTSEIDVAVYKKRWCSPFILLRPKLIIAFRHML